MTESESYMYAQYVGTWKKLVYNVGLVPPVIIYRKKMLDSYNRWSSPAGDAYLYYQ